MSNNETDNAALEVVPLSAIHGMERAQIDSQVATAHQYPRSLEKFKTRALAMATLDAETAESCIYVRPVGKEKDERTGEYKMKFAEGPSIRMAEIVGCCYGNIRVAARIVEQTPRYIKAEGVCHDLESNYAGKADVVESTVDRNGKPYSERQQALIAKVAVAKAYRDAIFRVVPRALIKPPFEAAKKVLSGEKAPIVERVKRVQAWIASRKIDPARALAVLGIPSWDVITEDHLTTLTGLKTAVMDGEPIDEVFPALEGQAAANAPAPTAHQQATQPPQNVVQMPPQQPPAEPEKRKPGRPKKTEEQAAQTAAQQINVPPQVGEAKQPEPPAQATQTAAEPTDAELAAMGLAPEPEEPAKAPEPAAAEVPPQQASGKAPFKPVAGETEELTKLRKLMYDSDVTEGQLWGWMAEKKLAKPPATKLAELATGKINSLFPAWAQILPTLQARPK